MSRRKPLVLTFDAFGTLFTPREPIGQQYVRTLLFLPSPPFPSPHILRLDARAGAVRPILRQGFPSINVLARPASLLEKKCGERGIADSKG